MHRSRPKAIFFGSAEFSLPTLRKLHAADSIDLIGVVTQPVKPRGRGLQPTPTPVQHFAEKVGLTVWAPARVRDPQLLAQIQHLRPDFMVVVAYGQILPPALLAIPPYGILNVHASLLPAYRGPAPIQRALLNGEDRTGVTIMRIDEGVDTGDILAKEEVPIRPEDTAQTLHDTLAERGAELLLRILPDYLAGRLTPQKQDPQQASYAPKITREDSWIDWGQPAQRIWYQIRALNPWPGAVARLPTSKRPILKIWQGRPAQPEELPPEAASARPGTILQVGPQGILVACGEGALWIERLQQEGGRVLGWKEFVAGHPMQPGMVLRPGKPEEA